VRALTVGPLILFLVALIAAIVLFRWGRSAANGSGKNKPAADKWRPQRERLRALDPDSREAAIDAMLSSSGVFDKFFHSKIAGVAHSNNDGSDRQQIAARCDAIEDLDLVREPANPVDPCAVAVKRASGEQLGYLTAYVAAEVGPSMDAGREWGAMTVQKTGGTAEHPHRGVNIVLFRKSLQMEAACATTLS
jgi:hypothetical protein